MIFSTVLHTLYMYCTLRLLKVSRYPTVMTTFQNVVTLITRLPEYINNKTMKHVYHCYQSNFYG